MNVRYKLVGWEFNTGAWAQTMIETANTFDVEFVAKVMDVSPKTVQLWQKMKGGYEDFPHPNMSNFIKFCNEFDRDPREFFILQDV